MERLEEDQGGGGEITDPTAALYRRQDSRKETTCLSNKMAAASLPPQILQRLLPLAHPNQKHTGKGILGNIIQPTQVHSLQSHSLTPWHSSL